MKQVKALYNQITGLEAKTIVPIHGGLNSVNYLINGEFVLRRKNPSVDTRYDPERIYGRTPRGIDGTNPTLVALRSNVRRQTDRLHRAKRFFVATPHHRRSQTRGRRPQNPTWFEGRGIAPFDPLARYQIYKEASLVATPFHNEAKIIAYIGDRLAHDPLVFAHNDLVRGNILFKDDRVFIIDYEYAGLNHPLFDLASFITENNLTDPTLITAFLTAYYQEKNIPWRDFDVFCRFLDYLWYYWAQGMFVTTGQSIFKTIARLKWSRISQY
jgi:aminoglycoside phosphotransferase (APT) family kinase protein